MDRMAKAVACLLILLGAALSLAVPAAGDIRAVLAGGKGSHHVIVGTAVRQLMMTKSMKLEDVLAPELGMDLELHRRILGESIGERALIPNEARCLKEGCPARGGPYVGRNCDAYHRCQGTTPPK